MIQYDTKLESGREAGYFYYKLRYSGAFSNAKSLVSSFLHRYRLKIDDGAEGLAYMDHSSRVIVINPIQYLAQVDPYYDRVNQDDDVFEQFIKWGFLGVICHEIGHAFYTLPVSESSQYVQGSSAPEYFIHFCSNIVEDSFIQKTFAAQFTWGLIKESISASTAVLQGLDTCDAFSKKTSYDVQDKLMYFILKAYNPTFVQPAALGIPQELEDEFLSFYYHSDSTERFKYTVTWAEKMYELLKQDVQDPNNQPQQQGDPSDQGSPGGTGSGYGTGSGNGQGGMTDDEIAQAIKDVVDQLSARTGVGNGKSIGDFNKEDQKNLNSPSIRTQISVGIGDCVTHTGKSFSELARKLLSDYNLNFRRLQTHTFNGTAYNQTSGKLYIPKIYKSSLTPKIFTRETGRKRDMDLYFDIVLDTSGSMSETYPLLVDMVIPLIYSLNSLHAKTEAFVFANETYKLKDYYSNNINDLYATAHGAYDGGGTDMLPALQYSYHLIRQRNHKDKCIVIVTDGETDNEDECAEYVEALRKFGACVVGIGLRLDKSSYKCCSHLFGPDLLTYSSDVDMASNLAKDLTTLLITKFMRR